MSNQAFAVRPVGHCFQLVPLPIQSTPTPTPTPCIDEESLCVQQLQNFLNTIRPGGPFIPAGTNFGVSIFSGDFDLKSGFLDPTLNFNNQFILSIFDDPTLTPPARVIVNLCQVGVIIVAIGMEEEQISRIIDSIPSTFNRCTNFHSLCTQQLETAAATLIGEQVEIFSENTNNISIDPTSLSVVLRGHRSTLRGVKPGIIINSIRVAGQDLAIALSTCFISSIQRVS